MELTTIFHTELYPDSTPVGAEGFVIIRLISNLGFVAELGAQLVGEVRVEIDSNGYWEIDQVPNSKIDDGTTWYQVDIYTPRDDTRSITYQVPEGGGSYSLDAVEYSAPPSMPTPTEHGTTHAPGGIDDLSVYFMKQRQVDAEKASYGIAFDTKWFDDADMDISGGYPDYLVVNNESPFTVDDVGKRCIVEEAGVDDGLLVTHIISWIDSQTVQLADAAVSTVHNVTFYYGTDDTDGYAAAGADLDDLGFGTLFVAPGFSIVKNQLYHIVKSGVSLVGWGRDQSGFVMGDDFGGDSFIESLGRHGFSDTEFVHGCRIAEWDFYNPGGLFKGDLTSLWQMQDSVIELMNVVGLLGVAVNMTAPKDMYLGQLKLDTVGRSDSGKPAILLKASDESGLYGDNHVGQRVTIDKVSILACRDIAVYLDHIDSSKMAFYSQGTGDMGCNLFAVDCVDDTIDIYTDGASGSGVILASTGRTAGMVIRGHVSNCKDTSAMEGEGVGIHLWINNDEQTMDQIILSEELVFGALDANDNGDLGGVNFPTALTNSKGGNGPAVSADDTTTRTTTATSYGVLTGALSVVAQIGLSGRARVIVSCTAKSSAAGDGALMSFSCPGVSAADANACGVKTGTSGAIGTTENWIGSRETIVSGLPPGDNTFSVQARAVTGGTATFDNQRIEVIPCD